MKKIFLLISVVLIIFCGCSQNIEYQTMYIDNCTSTELRKEPSNDSEIIQNLNSGEAVSHEKDVKNGYSKIVYKGTTGYVLSTTLSEQEPHKTITHTPNKKDTEINYNINYETHDNNLKSSSETTHDKPKDTTNEVKNNTNQQNYSTSALSDEYIEERISTYIRPLYNHINSNINSYEKTVSGEATLWYDEGTLCKKELPQGAANYDMSRQYYYDANTGELVFAFVFKGSQEHRLYFENGKLIRYIDSNRNTVNNPTSEDSLKMAEFVLSESY